jgi:hypothetical protein
MLGIVAGLALAGWTPDPSPVRDAGETARAPLPADVIHALARLELSPGQQAQIDDLRGRERAWVEELHCALARSERDLRSAELEQPFDVERVNELVSVQAEVIAYLRGTESRLIAEISRLLTPDQERRFAELRTGAPEAAPARVLAALHPASTSCPAVHAALPGPEPWAAL